MSTSILNRALIIAVQASVAISGVCWRHYVTQIAISHYCISLFIIAMVMIFLPNEICRQEIVFNADLMSLL